MNSRIACAAFCVTVTCVNFAQAGILNPDFAWFSLESTGDCSINSFADGPGLALEIEKTSDDCTMTVGYNLTDTFTNGNLSGWGIELWADYNGGGQIASATNGTFGPGYDASVFGDDTLDLSTEIHLAASVSTTGGGTGPDGLLYTFDVSILGKQGGDRTDIYGDFENNTPTVYGLTTGYAWYGFVGPNPVSYGIHDYVRFPDVTPGWGPLPVITITNIPEPSAFCLLAAALAVGVRMRRR